MCVAVEPEREALEIGLHVLRVVVIPHQNVARDVDQVPGALPGERRRGRASAK